MKKNAKRRVNPLAIAAAVVIIAALAVTLLPRLKDSGGGAQTVTPGSDLTLNTEDIGTQASFFDYDADGVRVQLLAVRASDGTVRLALNTCQVCNGSPYAYFVQDGDCFICQNCHNSFSSDDIGLESGGCNPVPVTSDDYTEADGLITVAHSFLEDNASRFENWKKF